MLIPDLMIDDIFQLDAEALVKEGFRFLIFDIDNTIVPYEMAEPDDRIKAFFKSLDVAGIKVAFLSNNNDERVSLFNRELNYYYIADAHKPSVKMLNKCIAENKVPRENILFVGDQIFTDCLVAHRAKLKCYLVKPISPVNTWFFKFKRKLEIPFIKIYKHRNKQVKK